MADTREAMAAITDSIHKLASEDVGTYEARMILQLAEAWAWLRSPGQPHGGGGASASSD